MISKEQVNRVLESHPQIKHMVLLALYAEYVERCLNIRNYDETHNIEIYKFGDWATIAIR